MVELTYPFDELPAQGEWAPVAEGVYWIRMPLPMVLNHINLYALDDEDGWWLVDTGIGLSETQHCWEQLFAGPMQGKPVKGVIVTHMHPDHVGQAGWLCEKWRVPLYMSFGEYLSARTLTSLMLDSAPWTTVQYFERAGVTAEQVEAMDSSLRGFGSIVTPVPMAFQRLSDGDTLAIGGREWRVMTGSGHSPEHVCLFDPRDKLLFSGDQIIPRITSNISVMQYEPQANPLKSWLTSLARFEADLPEDTLVFPAHNEPFRGVKQRLRFLIEHHEDHLEAIEEACMTAAKAPQELFSVLFRREIGIDSLRMALGETLAHLNYLVFAGRLACRTGSDGVNRYRTINGEKRVKPGKVHQLDDGPMEV